MSPDPLHQAWTALTDGDDVAAAPVALSGHGGHLPSGFAVEELAAAAIATALRAAVALHSQGPPAPVTLDRAHVADACRSERSFTVDGRPAGATFAPLSRFWPAADGWVRTHANYPWHRRALLDALGVTEGAGPGTLDIVDIVDTVGAAIVGLPGEEVERRVVGAGGVAAAVRSFEEWSRHPQGCAIAAEPLVSCHVAGEAPPRPARPRLRVLDLTRVIAGPVCTRLLAALGAEVLRIDPPGRPDMAAGAFADTLLGKRSAALDLGDPEGAARVHALLGGADVLVQGYRPGAMERFGLSAEEVAERHPGTVVVVLDAWGHTGPWARRRGFDSVVQAATGLADGASAEGTRPGALPCQLLDHATGYLAAAAVLDGVRRQRRRGGTPIRRLSLARTAWWLAGQPARRGGETAAGAPPHGGSAEPGGAEPGSPANRFLVDLAADGHIVTAVAPPGTVGGVPLRWPHAGHGYVADRPAWDESPSGPPSQGPIRRPS